MVVNLVVEMSNLIDDIGVVCYYIYWQHYLSEIEIFCTFFYWSALYVVALFGLDKYIQAIWDKRS